MPLLILDNFSLWLFVPADFAKDSLREKLGLLACYATWLWCCELGDEVPWLLRPGSMKADAKGTWILWAWLSLTSSGPCDPWDTASDCKHGCSIYTNTTCHHVWWCQVRRMWPCCMWLVPKATFMWPCWALAACAPCLTTHLSPRHRSTWRPWSHGGFQGTVPGSCGGDGNECHLHSGGLQQPDQGHQPLINPSCMDSTWDKPCIGATGWDAQHPNSSSVPLGIASHLQFGLLWLHMARFTARFGLRRSLYAPGQQQEGCGQSHPARLPCCRATQWLTCCFLVALKKVL